MEIVEITANNLEQFTNLIGEEMAESIGRNDHIDLAAGENNESAIMWRATNSYKVEIDTVEILFFKAAQKNEGKILLLELVRRNSQDGKKQYHFYLDEPGEIEMELLQNFGFDIKKVESMDVLGKIRDIQIKKPDLSGDASYVLSISDLSYTEFREFLTKCFMKNKRGLNDDIAYLPMRWYDPDVSCCMMLNGKVTGLLLVHRTPEGILIPVFLYSSRKAPARDMLVMICYSIGMAAQKFSDEAEVRVIRRNQEIQAMTERLFMNHETRLVFEGNVKL